MNAIIRTRPARAPKSRGWRLAAACAVVAAATSAMLPAQAARHDDGPGAMGSMGLFMGPPQRIAAHVDHLLNGLNATDAQRAQITQIAQAAATDLKTQHAAAKALREQSLQIFTAPAVDAAAAESVREQMQAQHDQASRRVLQAMLDIDQVLTPDQRALIGTRIKQRQAAMQQRMQQPVAQ
jgi:Spy/CpxP family protein refolding chaperone